MEGITDRSFRRMVRQLGGCGLTVTEFVSSEAMTRDVQHAWRTAEIDPDEHPVAIQIYGRTPERMAQAALCCQDLGADFVDLNLGCPAKKVVAGSSGAALMREPKLAAAILHAVGTALTVPFTVKMRLGWDHQQRNAPEIARMAEDAGASMVTVHGRTRAQGFRGRADWPAIAAVKQAVQVPVLANGDIRTVADGRRALAESGADGLMVGRAMLRNPWLLRQIGDDMAGREPYEPTFADRRRILFEYFERMIDECEGRELWYMGRIKKVTTFFTTGLPYGSRLRYNIHHSHTIDQARGFVDSYFELLEQHRLQDAFRQFHDDAAELPAVDL